MYFLYREFPSVKWLSEVQNTSLGHIYRYTNTIGAKLFDLLYNMNANFPLAGRETCWFLGGRQPLPQLLADLLLLQFVRRQLQWAALSSQEPPPPRSQQPSELDRGQRVGQTDLQQAVGPDQGRGGRLLQIRSWEVGVSLRVWRSAGVQPNLTLFSLQWELGGSHREAQPPENLPTERVCY